MLALALPVLAEESLNLLVGYTDFFLAGRFLQGDEPLAAMGLVAYLLWVIPVLFQVRQHWGLGGRCPHGRRRPATRRRRMPRGRRCSWACSLRRWSSCWCLPAAAHS